MANRITNPLRRRHLKLKIPWISGHNNVEGNEAADGEAKMASEGDNSDRHLLPPQLAEGELPHSLSAVQQAFKATLKEQWKRRWKTSPRYAHTANIDPSLPSKSYQKFMGNLTRAQDSLLTQLRMGHIPLNKHLHRLKKSPSPLCPYCLHTDESVHHFLFECQALTEHHLERRVLHGSFHQRLFHI